MRHRAPAARRRHGLLAALPIRSPPGSARRNGAGSRLAAAEIRRRAADGARIALPADRSAGPRTLRNAGGSGSPPDRETCRVLSRAGRARRTRRVMELSTRYLGLMLPHPFVSGASPLAGDLDGVRGLEDAGAAAIVLPSLFEEDIERYGETTDQYLEHLVRTKRAVSCPVIASLNGTRAESWLRYAYMMERGGADALELNFYHVATDPAEDSLAVERRVVDIVAVLKETVAIPLAV